MSAPEPGKGTKGEAIPDGAAGRPARRRGTGALPFLKGRTIDRREVMPCPED